MEYADNSLAAREVAQGGVDPRVSDQASNGRFSTKTVLVIDDHALFRGGLRLLLGDVIGFGNILEASNFEQARDFVASGFAPELVTFDMSMPGLSGVEGLAALSDALPDARLVVIAGSERVEDVLGAFGAGAHGYIPKSLGSAEVSTAIENVLAGGVFVPRILDRRDEDVPQQPVSKTTLLKGYSFTARQRTVLDRLLTGAPTRKIAADLGLAEGTVKIHLAAIFRIVGVRSRAEVIAKLK